MNSLGKRCVLCVVSLIVSGLVLVGCQSMGGEGQSTMGGGGKGMEKGGMGMAPPMGSSEDIDDANRLWAALKQARLVGSGSIALKPYPGMPPHGAVLEVTHQELSVSGHRGMVIVKRNYGGPDVSIQKVSADRSKYLKAVTVMYKRESGYDADNKDWFWAKFKPDGSLHVKENMGMEIALAGRVAKGMPEGCIACHQGAPGGDYVFANDI